MIVVKTKIVKWVIETMGITLSCQPQNWLLVANSEVGNSEYIHWPMALTPLTIFKMMMLTLMILTIKNSIHFANSENNIASTNDFDNFFQLC